MFQRVADHSAIVIIISNTPRYNIFYSSVTSRPYTDTRDVYRCDSILTENRKLRTPALEDRRR